MWGTELYSNLTRDICHGVREWGAKELILFFFSSRSKLYGIIKLSNKENRKIGACRLKFGPYLCCTELKILNMFDNLKFCPRIGAKTLFKRGSIMKIELAHAARGGLKNVRKDMKTASWMPNIYHDRPTIFSGQCSP